MEKIGHILLIHYRFDPIALLIRIKTNSYWNHVVWFWDERTILECKKSGIRLTWADAYDDKRLYVTKIIKIKNLTSEKEEIINRLLINYPKKVNLLKRMISFLMLLWNSNKYLLELTCSGFIALGCAGAGIYFDSEKNPCRITPGDIANSESVEDVT